MNINSLQNNIWSETSLLEISLLMNIHINVVSIIFIYRVGAEKDSQEGLKMESSRQKETGKAKNDPEKKL